MSSGIFNGDGGHVVGGAIYNPWITKPRPINRPAGGQHGECRVIKPADPAKLAAYRETADYIHAKERREKIEAYKKIHQINVNRRVRRDFDKETQKKIV